MSMRHPDTSVGPPRECRNPFGSARRCKWRADGLSPIGPQVVPLARRQIGWIDHGIANPGENAQISGRCDNAGLEFSSGGNSSTRERRKRQATFAVPVRSY